MEYNINDTVYTIRHEFDVLKGTVIDKINEGDRFKYIVMFKLLTDDKTEYETSNVFYEWELFESEEQCLQHEYDRTKKNLECEKEFLKEIKEKLDKIKFNFNTCENCVNLCPTCHHYTVLHQKIKDEEIDRVDWRDCGFHKRK